MRALLLAAALFATAGGAAPAQEAEYFPEEQKPRLEYDLPLQVRAGASLTLGRLHLAADVNFSPAQPRIPFIRGRFGDDAVIALKN